MGLVKGDQIKAVLWTCVWSGIESCWWFRLAVPLSLNVSPTPCVPPVQLTLPICLFIKVTFAASFPGVLPWYSLFFPFWGFFILFYFMCLGALYTNSVHRQSQKRASNPLKLELETHVGAGNWILGPMEEQLVILTSQPSLQSNSDILMACLNHIINVSSLCWLLLLSVSFGWMLHSQPFS